MFYYWSLGPQELEKTMDVFINGHLQTRFSVATLALGFVTKVRACKNAGQEGSPGVTFYAHGNAK